MFWWKIVKAFSVYLVGFGLSCVWYSYLLLVVALHTLVTLWLFTIKKSSELVIGNLLFRLGTLLDNFSTVTGPFGLFGFMGHVTVYSSKGFAEFCLLMGSIFHFRGIMGVSLLLLSTSL